MVNGKKIQEHDLELVPVEEKHSKYIYKYLNNEQLLETYPESFPYILQQSERYIRRN